MAAILSLRDTPKQEITNKMLYKMLLQFVPNPNQTVSKFFNLRRLKLFHDLKLTLVHLNEFVANDFFYSNIYLAPIEPTLPGPANDIAKDKEQIPPQPILMESLDGSNIMDLINLLNNNAKVMLLLGWSGCMNCRKVASFYR